MKTYLLVVSVGSVVGALGCGARVSVGDLGDPVTPIDDKKDGGSSTSSTSSSSAATTGGSTGGPTTSGSTGGPTTSGTTTGGVILTDPACWASHYPPDPQPLPPMQPFLAACDEAAHGSWLDPDSGLGPPPSPGQPRNSDAKHLIVGRWAACPGTDRLRPEAHDGLEFGANGRWQLLAIDPMGGFSPTGSARGMFYMLNVGGLTTREDQAGASTSGRVALSPDHQAFKHESFEGGSKASIYVRIQSSPANGRDNVPSLSNGTCNLVGTWDSAPVPGAGPEAGASQPLSISFDGGGNFVAGPPGADLCASHTMYGTYALNSNFFELTQNVGMGLCDFWFNASYPYTFDSTCTRIILTQMYDNCTGGRGYFNNMSALVKRP